jgi:hypothetical protein
MPVSSHQVNQMMAGQQAMFGNNATYAQQISPMGQAMGMAPTYAAPYGPMASPGAAEFNMGAAAAPGMFNAAASYGAPMMMGAGMMMGGRMGAMIDPTTAAMRGFGAGAGWQGGAGISANLGNIARGGIGGIARGIGMAGLYAAPVAGLYSAGRYALGQMAEGAQFQNQTSALLQNTFRFTNPQSRTGYGFGQTEQRQIGSMLQQMGTRDIMTTPQELLGIMGQGAQMGVFRGVQDAREFRQRFTQMKESLKEIASTFNTTLGEALPFFQQARMQGFWTPQDITRHATQVRQVQSNTGMSAAQAQAVMGMGAQMVRAIGGTGQQGAEMMARAQQLSGAALFGGVVSSRQLGEAGFGTGAQGAQNLGQMLAGASTRFARSRVGRWALAAMMNREGTGLDQGMLQRFTTGGMSVGEIGRTARRNVSGGRAYQFVMNEGELRGQLAQAGPEAALGIVRGLTGGRLYGGGGRDRLVTRRIIQRFMGGTARQADMVARMAREMPRMMAIQAARTEGSLDAQERQREQMMQNTYEGFKRNMGQWWREKISSPLQEMGADFSYRVGRTWQRFTDRLFGTTGRGIGLSAEAVRSIVRSAESGNMAYVRGTMGDPGRMMGDLGGDVFRRGTLGWGGTKQMLRMDYQPTGYGRAPSLLGQLGQFVSPMLGPVLGAQFRREDIREMQALGAASRGAIGGAEAAAIGFGGAGEMRTAMGGQGARQIQEYLGSTEVALMRGRMGATLDEGDRLRYAIRVLTRVRQGRAGEQARQMFQGLPQNQAIGRLMAMQGGARGGLTGLGTLGGGLPGEGQDIRTRVEEFQEESTEDLLTLLRGGAREAWWSMADRAAAAAGGLAGTAVTGQGLEELKKDTRGERAMILFAQARAAEADGDADKAAEARTRARELMRDVAIKGGVSDAAKSAALSLANEGHPQARALAEAAGKSGAGLQYGSQVAFHEKIKRSRERFRDQLDPAGGMGRLVQAMGGEKSTLTQAFHEAMRVKGGGAGGMVSPEDHISRMTALAKAAIGDPEKARGMMAELRRQGLEQTDIGVTLATAIGARDAAQSMGLKRDIAEGESISAKARQGIRRRLMGMGFGEKEISRGDVTRLIRGEDVESIRERLTEQGWKRGDITKFLEEMRGGLTVGEMEEVGAREAAGMGARTLSTKVAKRAGLEPGDLQGKLTGESGGRAMVKELQIHTQWFSKMNHNLDLIAKQEKKPPTKDKKNP